MKKGSILVLIFLFALFSCHKNEDTQAPLIEINSPTENAQYQVLAQIPVIGTVYDNVSLDYVRIQLLDENLVAVLPAMNLHPETNTLNLQYDYALDNILLETAHYYLMIQASDGLQVTSKFIKIFIQSAPRELKYLIAVTRSGSQLHVVKIDSIFQTHTLLSLTSDYLGSGLCNDYGLFYICGSYKGDLSVYNTGDWQMEWNVPVTINPPFAWFTGFYLKDSYCWLGYRTGKYEKYDHYGSQKMSVNTTTTWAPQKFCRMDNRLICEEKNPAGVERELVVHYEFSGVVYDELFISEPVFSLLPLDEDYLCQLTNDGSSQGHLYVFNVESAISWEPPTHFQSGKVLSAINVGEDVLIGHESGLYRFVNTNYSLINWIPGLNAQALCYEDVNGWILAAQGSNLKFYLNQWPSYTAGQTLSLGDTIVAIHAVYNKDQ